MEFYPYQMNQTLAAKYCDVSITHFKKEYRPYLRERKKGGYIYFLKTDLEKFIRDLFNEKKTVHKLKNKTVPNKNKKDAFTNSLENLQTS